MTSQKELELPHGLPAPQCPPSPGRAITKAPEDRPASLDLRHRQAGFPQQPPHNPMLYLGNNNLAGHINPAMLSQATAMAQHQLAAANLLAHGLDPRGLSRLPGPPGPLSPRGGPPGQGGGRDLARFFSPEVLAQAQSGGVPAMPPLPTQKVLVMENFQSDTWSSFSFNCFSFFPSSLIFRLSILFYLDLQVLTLEEIERQAAAVRI